MKKEERIKSKIKPPFDLMLGLFVLEVIIILVFFFNGGMTIFKTDTTNTSLFISLGMLTFISVFYGFIFTKDDSFLTPFGNVIKKHVEELESELDERYKKKNISKKFLKEYEDHKKALKGFGFLVNPILWFNISIFIFIFAILANISTIKFKGIVLSVLIYLGILSSLFLVTSISTIYLAFLLHKNKEEIKSPNVGFRIASEFDGRIRYNLFKDWNAWFQLINNDNKQYLIYITLTFLSEGHEICRSDSNYYNGVKPWKIHAKQVMYGNGFGIPEEIKKEFKQGKEIEIRINCEVRDEKNKIIETKLPQGYVYAPHIDDWYLEP